MLKKQLREIYKQKREKISEQEYSALNKALFQRVHGYLNTLSGGVHVFLGNTKLREPDTISFLLLEQVPEHSSRYFVVSEFTKAFVGIKHYYWDNNIKITTNTKGYADRIEGKQFEQIHKIQAVIVPLLAYDRFGHRVGYGLGWYDRFLATLPPQVLKIGLSFFEPNNEKIEDIDGLDIKMNTIITPSEVLFF